jgi:predicted helicase
VTIAEYVAELRKNLIHGDATEHTHRPALKALLESAGKSIIATNEPKRIACGAPDFIITRKAVPLGHVETKDIGTPLGVIEQGKGPHGEQFKRYRDGLPNWVLTDYVEFRWYLAGERRLTANLGVFDGKKKFQASPHGEDELNKLLEAFFREPALTVESAKDLADRMAGMTRIVRDLIAATFTHGSDKDQKQLHNWLAAFKETLIPDLDEEQFSDMFAQTLSYGLFAARVHSLRSTNAFSREMAAYNLPKTNPFLRKLFAEIAGVDMPDTFGWAVDDLVALLNHANWGKVLKDFGAGKAKHDPVVHFYETFLAAYDPKMREIRGVYYTPEPVVSYIVRSIDHLLQEHFAKPKGLADEKTLILDPAVGTATFLFSVIQQIYARFAKQKGAWDGYVGEHLLNRVFGFELLMAPYAVAHLKLGMELQETGYTFSSDQRLGIFLTNTLEEAAKKSEKLFAQWISDEANAAAEIKRTRPILVVLGNPPYSGHSANRSRDDEGKLTFIGNLIEDYKKVDGQPLGEKNPKWLQDDYVKFIRFAQWRIERTGHGVLGFITNHGYLDNPTFRGMRQSLMQSFTSIYVCDLHGNTKRKERAPDGGKDENVFDIQQGVAILLAVKEANTSKAARVFHEDLWGLRNQKYATLSEDDVAKTKWQKLNPVSPSYLFVPQDTGLQVEYGNGSKITEAMPLYSLAMNTHRDDFAVAFGKDELIKRIEKFIGAKTDEECYEIFGLEDNPDFSVPTAREALKVDTHWRAKVIRCLYRPFDFRWCLFSDAVVDRPRPAVNQQMLKENLSLITTRQNREPFFVLVTDLICGQHKIVARYDGSYVFPLWKYSVQKGFAFHSERRANFDSKFELSVNKLLGRNADPELIFAYLYAILSSSSYRMRYTEFLKREFPRVPVTPDVKLFAALAAKGQELIRVHLMQSPLLDKFITEFPVKGDNVVEKVAYNLENGRVWINPQQYFGGVPQTIWAFHVGGYQVCERWLKDRKGRKLTYDDLQHWQRIVVAIQETVRLTEEIDALIPGWPLP